MNERGLRGLKGGPKEIIIFYYNPKSLTLYYPKLYNLGINCQVRNVGLLRKTSGKLETCKYNLCPLVIVGFFSNHSNEILV
jgi:hypothetical protein